MSYLDDLLWWVPNCEHKSDYELPERIKTTMVGQPTHLLLLIVEEVEAKERK